KVEPEGSPRSPGIVGTVECHIFIGMPVAITEIRQHEAPIGATVSLETGGDPGTLPCIERVRAIQQDAALHPRPGPVQEMRRISLGVVGHAVTPEESVLLGDALRGEIFPRAGAA